MVDYIVPGLMAVFTLLTFAGVAVPLAIIAPKRLEARRAREIAQLTASAEVLARTIARTHNEPAYHARLSANYEAHARALTQLGQPVPAIADAAPALKAA
jgi:hypothetical protein